MTEALSAMVRAAGPVLPTYRFPLVGVIDNEAAETSASPPPPPSVTPPLQVFEPVKVSVPLPAVTSEPEPLNPPE